MIQIKNITKDYVSGDSKVTALDNVSISFRESEFVSILGQSGCGKTTLLNVLGGLDRYTSGDIIINGKSTKEFKDKDWDAYRNHYIGFIFQSYNLIPHLTVLENVEIALSIAGISSKEKKEKATKALERVGLGNQLKKRPNQLSGGQMQRVAIARAIVNNPKIILADEPTGALDSATSVQIMDLLKEIAGDHLIIMVTHNQELAKEYSTRIISLLDGKVVGDTMPYDADEKISKEVEQEEQVKLELNAKQKPKKLKSAMGFFTAIMLSLKNLLTKKGRTFMTSFAGSIGIIGIALVLAVSNGFTGYVNNMQSNALGNYPLAVSAITMDTSTFSSMQPATDSEQGSNEDVIVPYNPQVKYTQYGHYNQLTQDFVDEVKDFEQKDKQKTNPKFNAIDYNYYVPVKMITKDSSGNYKFIQRQNTISIMDGSTSSLLYPMLGNTEYVLSQYDLIYNSMPTKNNGDAFTKGMLLVVGKGNKINYKTLNNLGIATQMEEGGTSYKKINFADVINQEYKLLFNNDYYTPNSENFDDITSFSHLDTSSQTELENKYNSLETTVKITGVLRLKKDATSEILPTGLVYMHDLEQYYKEDCENSLINKKSQANKQNGDYTLYQPYHISVSELQGVIPSSFASIDAINSFLNRQYKYTLSDEETFEIAMQSIGTSKIPTAIRFFPKDFTAKDSVIKMIDEFNNKQTDSTKKIICTDTSSLLTSTLGELIQIISYVLIAFAGISLIVSSIMISIITYVSVIERTKEIGVLRSIGARKKDISRVFNAETLIIGFCSGLLGVVVSFILTFPISAIIKSVSGGSITTNLAILSPLSAVILVAISVVLTVLAGFIPSQMAAKKDPVKALRSE